MNKICTSLDQSKKLMELGIDTDTADMCYKCLGEDPYDLIVRPYSDWKEEYKVLLRSGDAKVYPAWSLTALWKLLPSDFDVKGEFGTSNYQIRPRKYRFSADIDVYQIAYGNYLIGNSMGWKDMFNTPECENFVDAAFETILKLNELNLL